MLLLKKKDKKNITFEKVFTKHYKVLVEHGQMHLHRALNPF